jgi:hypothetical protein
MFTCSIIFLMKFLKHGLRPADTFWLGTHHSCVLVDCTWAFLIELTYPDLIEKGQEFQTMSYQYLDIELGSGCRKEIFTPMYFFLVRKPLEWIMYFLLSCLLFFSIVGWIRTVSTCSLIETASNCCENSRCRKHTSVTKGVEAWDATKALQLAPSGLDMVILLWEVLLHRTVNCWNLGEYITVLALSGYA